MGSILETKNCIYKFTNKLNGKAYIGQTTMKLKDRITCHLAPTSKLTIGKALKKYGINNFEIEVLHTTDSIEELNEKEEHFIELFNTLKLGYNERPGGKNYKVTEEMKLNLSKAHNSQKRAVKQYDLDGNFIKEFLSARDAWRETGVHYSNIADVCLKSKHCITAGGFRWSYADEKLEMRQKKIRGKRMTQFTKSGEYIKDYVNASTASKELDINLGHITESCKGVRKSAGGFKWSYAEVCNG